MDDELRALLLKRKAAALAPAAPAAAAPKPRPTAAPGVAPAATAKTACTEERRRDDGPPSTAAGSGAPPRQQQRPQPTPPSADASVPGDGLVPFRLQHRKTSSDEMRALLGGRPVVQLKQLAGLIRRGWPEDAAVVGVLASKTGPKRGNSGNEFVIWTLDDLDGHGVSVFLFGAACQGARSVEPGMVCLLTDPRLLENRNNGEGKSAAMPLSVSQPYQILQAGYSADFALCSAGGGACNRVFSRAGGQRFCQLHHGGGGGAGGGSGSGSALSAAAAQQQRKPALPQRGPTLVSVGSGRGGGGGGLIVRPAGMAGGPKQAAEAGKKAGKPGQGRLQGLKASLDKSCLSYKDGWKTTSQGGGNKEKGGPAAAAAATTASVQASTIVPRVIEGNVVRSVALARAEADDNPRRDGSVIVPEQSALFNKGADGVKYQAYLHKQHQAIEQRMKQRYHVEDQRSAQARAQAAKALKNPGGGVGGSRGALRGTIVMAPGAAGMAGAGRAAGAGSKGLASSTAPPPPAAAAASMTAEEADRLMKTKSRHSAEARMEMMDQMESIFESLGEKENQQEHAKTVASVDVAAYQCEKCGRLSEKWPKLCQEQGHRVKKVQTKKRFFVCANPSCGGQASLLGPGMHPKEACPKCGERLWRVRGKGKPLNGGDDRGKGGLARPVAAIADWNRYDGSVDGLFA